jgi:hypothetical protein
MDNGPHNVLSCLSEESRKPKESKDPTPWVGLFYVVGEKVYWDGIPAPRADGAYFRSYPQTHSKFWDQSLCRFFPQLREHDFTHFPRGRVVFDVKKDSFMILADKCLGENPTMIEKIASEMSLPKDRITVSVDKDCECAKCRQKRAQSSVFDGDNPDSYFKTTSSGRKVFFPNAGTLGYFRSEGYIVPNDKAYEKLRRRMHRKYVLILVLALVVAFAAEVMYESTRDVAIMLLVVVFLTLFMILYAVLDINWLQKQALGWKKTDEKQ